MIFFLKVVSLIITAIVGIWTAWPDFHSKRKKFNRTIIIYGSLLLILSILSFWVSDLDDEKKETAETKNLAFLVNSSRILFDSQKTILKSQYRELSGLSKELSNQNEELKSQLLANQELLNYQHRQSEINQTLIKNTAEKSIHKIDSVAMLASISLKGLNDLSLMQQKNIQSLSGIRDDLSSLSQPLEPFQITFTIKISLEDSITLPNRKYFNLYHADSRVPFVDHLALNKGGYESFMGPLSIPVVKLLNAKEYEDFFLEPLFQFDIEFLSDTDGVQQPNGFWIVFNKEKIGYNRTVKKHLPYYLFGDPMHIYQEITVTFDSILGNPNRIMDMYALFKKTFIKFQLAQAWKKGYKLNLNFENGVTEEKFEKPVIFKKIEFVPVLTIAYGKNLGIIKHLSNSENFKIPFQYARPLEWIYKEMEYFDASGLAFVNSLN